MLDKKLIDLKKSVYSANMRLQEEKLVMFTFGNVSGIDRERQIVAIKPSGVDYNKLTYEDIVLVSLDGKIVHGNLNPSSDTKTHLKLYMEFLEIGGVAHTHSIFATAFAQAHLPIKCLGTTHADYFFGDIPCSKVITDKSIGRDYEEETGNLIIDTFRVRNLSYKDMKACLVASHGPFTWGSDAGEAVFISAVLEEIARLNIFTQLLNPSISSIRKTLLDKHYLRKHGKNAYYGQH
ncbi:MAG: L-ribulose-5-phosphate 4-epimerase AraD [Actinobacteria bacterium]|nr:L-ribulose-5-phosphate 4-epimerase AraD [Actinomycetota bacterium]